MINDGSLPFALVMRYDSDRKTPRARMLRSGQTVLVNYKTLMTVTVVSKNLMTLIGPDGQTMTLGWL